ncbi:MAG TPA: transcription-repair coupling factor [Actinomycetota bacterium]|nr:transcription-repair coupling factor [Actinomycetota bacterium]
MLERVLDALIASEPFERLLVERARPIVARAEAGGDVLLASLARALDSPLVAVAPGPREAEALAHGVRAFLGPRGAALFPAWEALPYEGISPSPETAARRAEAARALRRAHGPFVLVTPAHAALQGLVPTLGEREPLVLAEGQTFASDRLAQQLVELGYVRSEVVEHRGEFAVRGGIVDVFPGTVRRPVRVELFGDDVESLREFVPATQLSTDAIARVEVFPVRELTSTAELRERAEHLAPRFTDRFRDALTRFADGLWFEGMEALAPLLFDRLPTIGDLLPHGCWVVLSQARRTMDRARQALDEAEQLAEASGWPGPPVLRPLDDVLQDRTRLHLTEFAEGIDLGLEGWGTAQGNAPELAERLLDLAGRGYRVVVTAGAHGSLERAREVISERGLSLDGDARAAAWAVEADLAGGFVFPPGRLAVATEEDLFGTRRHTRSAPRITKRRADALALELQPGDFAVHRVHGVGRFVGVQRRAVAGAERDYLVLEYAAGDRLSVPTDQVGMVAKYLGGETPRLTRLGTNDWVRTTGRVKRAVKDMAGELVRLYSVRLSVEGHPFGPDAPWQREMEDAFPHEETHDQASAIDEVKRDMERPRPMDRLICGDVGYGKTEIAVRAAFKAVMDGKQVAVLVPTTLLAEQHFVTFSERFAPFPVRVAMLSRFLSQAEQQRVVEDVAAGRVDVVVGTHRLLSKDLRFHDLGLLVVDEEQRFGVSHKERLKSLRAHVDVLTMTATPIPRTLEMALTGIRDMSVVDTPPEDRQPVLTYVGPYAEDLALGAVRRELLRGGQIFWVHNRVATLDRQAAWIAEQVPEARIVVAHGQMDEELLEKQMLRFWDRDADVLVCTTIIESGLDVPSANTLVVDRADRLGLSQMYQLRGRVGRSTERAFSYFFFPPAQSLTEEAHERLSTISRHTALGSGFQIALRDLEIRGAGNILGAEQHGHIAAVGFDTYARLLRESVAEMKGEPLPEERDIRVDLPVKAFIPVGWVGQEALRLELYRNIATAGDHERLSEVRAEAEDRFGQLPPEVSTLLDVASLRITCERLGVQEVSTYRQQVRVKPFPLTEARELDLALTVPGASYHRTTGTLNLVPERVAGADLPSWVERALRATGSGATSVTIAR